MTTTLDDKILAQENALALLEMMRSVAEAADDYDRMKAPRRNPFPCIRACNEARELLSRLNLR